MKTPKRETATVYTGIIQAFAQQGVALPSNGN